MERFADYHPRDGPDEAEPLGCLDEGPGQDDAAVLLPHPGEHLVVGYAVLREPHDGLEPGLEPVLLERVEYPLLALEPHVHLLYLALLRAVEVEPVPALLLCPVHGRVGPREELGGRLPVLREERHADARRKVAGEVRLVEAFEPLPYVLGYLDRLDPADRREYRELVPAQSRHHAIPRGPDMARYDVPHVELDEPRDPHEELVPHAVAVGVAYELELVYVEEKERARPRVLLDPVSEGLDEICPVEKACDSVVVGEVIYPLVRGLLFGDVLEDREVMRYLAGLLLYGRDDALAPQGRAVLFQALQGPLPAFAGEHIAPGPGL